jgi:hypothetical protein
VTFVLLLLVLLFMGGVTGVVLLLVAVRRAAVRLDRRRRDALYAWTMTRGWRLHEGDAPTSWRHRFSGLSRFQIRRLATGAVGTLAITAADCHYVTHHTDAHGTPQTTNVDLSVFVARLPGMWPDIEVRGRHLGSRLLRALGRSSRVEIGHPLFDQRFQVETADPRAAHALLSPALVDAHLRGQVPYWSLQGGELLITERGHLSPERAAPGVDRLVWLASAIGAVRW